jgi:hypothetical protein
MIDGFFIVWRAGQGSTRATYARRPMLPIPYNFSLTINQAQP